MPRDSFDAARERAEDLLLEEVHYRTIKAEVERADRLAKAAYRRLAKRLRGRALGAFAKEVAFLADDCEAQSNLGERVELVLSGRWESAR